MLLKFVHWTRIVSLAIVIGVVGLSGCSTHKRSAPDGAPKHIPVNLDRIPNAEPKVEPLSRYGNRFKNSNTYVAKNKRYKVMPTSRGYKAHGYASWYGTKFHGRRTSSGERYNMFAMTAAHRSLPLPTYAKVTNVDNGKSVIVKVNDRGPFHNNRLLDLSYAAAHKLGILGKGTGKVCVESVDPRDHQGKKFPFSKPKTLAAIPDKPMKAADEPKAAGKGKLYVQLGAYSQKPNAEVLAQKVEQFSKLPTIIQENQNNKRTLYRVRLGPFKDQQAVTALAQKLAAARYPNPVVVRE